MSRPEPFVRPLLAALVVLVLYWFLTGVLPVWLANCLEALR